MARKPFSLRSLHLYLGCIFAPMLIFFIISGCLQTFNLHADQKNGYKAPLFIKAMAQAHKNQRWIDFKENTPTKESQPLKYYILVMSAGLLLTIILGIVLSFQVTKTPFMVLFCLFLGLILPVLMLFLV